MNSSQHSALFDSQALLENRSSKLCGLKLKVHAWTRNVTSENVGSETVPMGSISKISVYCTNYLSNSNDHGLASQLI